MLDPLDVANRVRVARGMDSIAPPPMPERCRYLKDGKCTNRLALPTFQRSPSAIECVRCEHRDGIRGLGDVVAWLLSFTVARKMQKRGCGGCKQRQEALNRAVPARRPCGSCGKPQAP